MIRLIDWFARNHISANLMMGVLFVGGTAALFGIPQKLFPDVDLPLITIAVPYPGAGPSEVEDGVCTRVEEAVESITGIKTMRSTATEGACAVFLELFSDTDASKTLSEIKNAIDGIQTFPENIERPIVAQASMNQPVLDIAVSGPAEERVLKELAQKLRDDLVALGGVTQAGLAASRPYEISIEVSEAALRRHALTFSQVARAVRRSSLDLPAGSIKAEGGEILLRTKGQAYRGREFEDIVVIRRADGTRVTLGEVATVVDGFAESDFSVRFNGEPGVMVRVSRTGNENTLAVAKVVKDYLAVARARMPEGIALTVWRDSSLMLRGRLDTLIGNGRLGMLLVLIVLTLFLRPRLAFWVSVGVPVAVLGSMIVLSYFDVSIDGITLFGFILVLGLLVDDAIVIAENVHTHQQRGEDRLRGAIEGTQEVSVPVIFGVLTTMMAFMPLWFTPGMMGSILKLVAFVVVACLCFSLIESQLILPAHLGHGRERSNLSEVTLMLVPLLVLVLATVSPGLDIFVTLGLLAALVLLSLHLLGWLAPAADRIIAVQTRFADSLQRFIQTRYRHWLSVALEWRYTSVAAAMGLLLISAGAVMGGHMRFTFFPPYEGDTISAQLTMPQGMPAEATLTAVRQIEGAIDELRAELDPIYAQPGESIVKHVFATLGGQPSVSGHPGPSTGSPSGSNVAQVTVELSAGEQRDITTEQVTARWRELTGDVPDATELTFDFAHVRMGESINVQLRGQGRRGPARGRCTNRGKAARVPRSRRRLRLVRGGKAGAQALDASLGRVAQPEPRGPGPAGPASVLRRGGPAHSTRARRRTRPGPLPGARAALSGGPRDHADPNAGRGRSAVRHGRTRGVRPRLRHDPPQQRTARDQRDRRCRPRAHDRQQRAGRPAEELAAHHPRRVPRCGLLDGGPDAGADGGPRRDGPPGHRRPLRDLRTAGHPAALVQPAPDHHEHHPLRPDRGRHRAPGDRLRHELPLADGAGGRFWRGREQQPGHRPPGQPAARRGAPCRARRARGHGGPLPANRTHHDHDLRGACCR